MIFCGQCGLQLKADNTTCPRCGAKVTPDPIVSDLHPEEPTVTFAADNATALSPIEKPSRPSNPDTPQTPAPESTLPVAHTPIPAQPLTPQIYPNNAYNGYPPQGPYSDPGSTYPSPQSQPMPQSYYGAGNPPQQMGYGTYYPTVQPVYIQPAQPQPAPRRSGCALMFTLAVLLLLVVVGAGFLVLRQNGTLNQYLGNGNATPPPQQTSLTGNGNTPTTQSTPTAGVTPTATLTNEQSASAVVQNYYADINKKDYQSAYNLLGSSFQNQQSYASFSSGYAHTQHDGLTIQQATAQSDGTVRVDITVDATEDSGQRTFTGYDIVGMENGQWKILSGHLA